MTAEATAARSPVAPLWGELRYSRELARLLAGGGSARMRARAGAQPVLLIPGFMAGDSSMAMMRYWLRRRGHPVAMSGMRANVDCAERVVCRLDRSLIALAADSGAAGVSDRAEPRWRAGAIAGRAPSRLVSGLVMLGSPVCDPLAVSAPVLRTVRWMAWLGDRRAARGVLESCARRGLLCRFRADLTAPLPAHIEAVAMHSQSDGIVDWRACLDPYAETVQVDSSHCGMAVHPDVYRMLERVLDSTREGAWSG